MARAGRTTKAGAAAAVHLPAAVRCPACGAGSHPAAAYCATCGAPLRAGSGGAPARWEYLDAGIPVDLCPLREGFLDEFDLLMREALAAYGAEGWEPASPTDWPAIVAADRFAAGMRAPRWWPLAGLVGGEPVVRHVLVRFRRPY